MCFLMDPGLVVRGFASTVWPWGSNQGNNDCLQGSLSIATASFTPSIISLCEWLVLFTTKLSKVCCWHQASPNFCNWFTWNQPNPNSSLDGEISQNDRGAAISVQLTSVGFAWDQRAWLFGNIKKLMDYKAKIPTKLPWTFHGVKSFVDIHRWGIKRKEEGNMGSE